METRENNGRRTNSVSHSHTHTESFHSPLRANSPLRSDDVDPPFSTPEASPVISPCKAIVAFDKFPRTQTPLEQRKPMPEHRRPVPEQRKPVPDQRRPVSEHRKPVVTRMEPPNLVTNATTDAVRRNAAETEEKSPVVVYNRSVRENMSVVPKVEDAGGRGGCGGGGLEGDGGGGGENRSPRAVTSILRRSRREEMLRRGALGFRVCEVVFCLISFSVMAADKTQGWSGDSFDRYKEYRYCLSVAIIGFVYSGFQACDLVYYLVTGKHAIRHHLRFQFDFFTDQALAYLLISASSAAATRVDDWQSNWGKDEFTEMASASVGMSFLAFVAFAFSSVVSGYNLCTQDPSRLDP